MKNIAYILLLTFSLISVHVMSQTSAGKCWDIDYETWNINQPQLHIDCGDADMFNVGNEMTLELWIRAYTFGENRKVMGKIDSDGEVFDNGYVIGFQNLNVYTEIWNPTLQQIPYANAGPIPQDSAFVHIASTYSASTMKLSDYINGQLVASVDIFPPNSIAPNEAIFLIGAAPWGTNSFQFYGTLDEVRVWNKARTEAEISEYMYKELKGDEEGLVAYYNFNTAQDTIVPDMSSNDNTGELRNSDDPCWSWADSFIPVGDDKMYDMADPVAAWCGSLDEEFNVASSESGLTIFTDIQEKEFNKYLLFGNNSLTGTATDFAPDESPADFIRINREWYLNKGGDIISDVFFNLSEAAGGGDELPAGEDAKLYALMFRGNSTDNFLAIAHPDQVFNENLIFNDLNLKDGYYCVGYASTEIPLEPSAVIDEKLEMVSISPNPARDHYCIKNGKGLMMVLSNNVGQKIIVKELQSDSEIINTSHLDNGMYFIQLKYKNQVSTKKLIIN